MDVNGRVLQQVRSSFFLRRSQNERERLAVLHVGRRYPVSSFSLWREREREIGWEFVRILLDARIVLCISD